MMSYNYHDFSNDFGQHPRTLTSKLDQVLPLLEAIASRPASSAAVPAPYGATRTRPYGCAPPPQANYGPPQTYDYYAGPDANQPLLPTPYSSHPPNKRFKASSTIKSNASYGKSPGFAKGNAASGNQGAGKAGFVSKKNLLEEEKINKFKAAGAVPTCENSINGYKCIFCDVFLNSVATVEQHFESPRHAKVSYIDIIPNINSFINNFFKIFY